MKLVALGEYPGIYFSTIVFQRLATSFEISAWLTPNSNGTDLLPSRSKNTYDEVAGEAGEAEGAGAEGNR